MGTPYRKHIPSGLPVPPPQPWRWVPEAPATRSFIRAEPADSCYQGLALVNQVMMVFIAVTGVGALSVIVSLAYAVVRFVHRFW